MKRKHQLDLYSALARIRFLKNSYTAKILVVAFIGTHIPLLTLFFSFVISNSYTSDMAMGILLIALLATLAGTLVTLCAINNLMVPVIVTSAALQNYLKSKRLPELPTDFSDEVGTLMADTSQTIHQLDGLIHYISNYDDLTGLPNRDLFCDRLHHTLSQPQNLHRLIAIFLIRINDFHTITNTLDHPASNLLIRAIAQRLNNSIAPTDLLARCSKDEFAIARMEFFSIETLINLCQLLLDNLAKPFFVEGKRIQITASIGMTINHLEADQSIDQLLQEAHIALYQMEQPGSSQYQFYSPEMNAQLQERLTLEEQLYGALERGEMVVYYQPLIDLHSGQIKAMEALVRWNHPINGLVSPAKFIPIAEANGFIIPIGEWVLRTACIQNCGWQKAGFPPIRISVNLSARQFEQPNLVEIVSQILHDTGMDAAYLELEVTESFLMTDINTSIQILQELRELGISLALDDFGTGYSSLSYLKRFPVNMLKIDRSFVQDVTSNPDSAAVTDAIIGLAKNLRLNITAEGIETQEQLDYLQKRGCEEGQGFYISRPEPAEVITEILKNRE
ncbi:EAL domain-containing protein [Nodularia harveyana UHCC-0300]|uniref:EAL domain-containing protein n=1 Tax=Nodularia harveyana UHCC-0300 TaxID=2974287 RepID=A0ABU5U9T8_9CYAN|nr:EAL domain-containing protein [Nodularia harveyana]MEA5580282.1 EAL domain-containing protein [Nodularia harveyana UHCC-0300]